MPRPDFLKMKLQRTGLLGCQMVRVETKNTDLGKFFRVLQWKMLVYFKAIWSILWPTCILCGFLVYFRVLWYIYPLW
jgi:hypothetical protein